MAILGKTRQGMARLGTELKRLDQATPERGDFKRIDKIRRDAVDLDGHGKILDKNRQELARLILDKTRQDMARIDKT